MKNMINEEGLISTRKEFENSLVYETSSADSHSCYNLSKPSLHSSSRKMNVISTLSLKELVLQANERGVSKDDIVNILKSDDQYMLIYYK